MSLVYPEHPHPKIYVPINKQMLHTGTVIVDMLLVFVFVEFLIKQIILKGTVFMLRRGQYFRILD